MWPPRASTPRRQETLGARPPPARCGTDRLHTAPATSDRGPMGKLSPGSQSRVLPQPRPGWRLQGRSEPRHPAATRVCSPRRTPGTLTWEEAAPTLQQRGLRYPRLRSGAVTPLPGVCARKKDGGGVTWRPLPRAQRLRTLGSSPARLSSLELCASHPERRTTLATWLLRSGCY